jgi:hypothetical protein
MAESVKGKKEVIERPENWDDMVKKHEQRETEQEKRLIEKRGVSNPEELIGVAKDTLAKKSLRAEHQTLKDRRILTDAKSPEVGEMRKKLNDEIVQFAKTALKVVPSLSGHPGLKGRITAGSHEERHAGSST